MVLENDLNKLVVVYMQLRDKEPQKVLAYVSWFKAKQKLCINTNGVKVLAEKHVKIFGVEIESKLKLDRYIEALCEKDNKKASALARLDMYISREQALSV